MSHTFESVVKHFGDKAQIVGGSIIVNVEGKNVEVGHMHNTTGVFTLTDKGQALLEDAPAKKAKAKPEPAPAPAPVVEPAPAPAPTVDLGLENLGK